MSINKGKHDRKHGQKYVDIVTFHTNVIVKHVIPKYENQWTAIM